MRRYGQLLRKGTPVPPLKQSDMDDDDEGWGLLGGVEMTDKAMTGGSRPSP